jgi:hypothetical protein
MAGTIDRKSAKKIVLDNSYEVIQSPILVSVEVIVIDKVSYKKKEKKEKKEIE